MAGTLGDINATAGIDDVPAEILHQIVSLIDPTLLSFRCTSHRYNVLSAPFIVQSLTILLSRNLRHYNNRNHPLPFHPVPDIFVKHIGSLRVHLADIFIQTEDEDLEALWPELARFSGIAEVQITCADSPNDRLAEDPQDTSLITRILEMILDATDGYLRHLRITAAPTTETLRMLPESMMRIHGLEMLHLARTYCRLGLSSPNIVPQTRQLIANNPHIKDLSLINACNEIPLSLTEVLPPHLDEMSLQRLVFFTFLTTPSESFTIPALKHLRYLTISAPGKHSTIVSTSACDPLWNALRESKVAIESLRTNYISFALTDYLSSFTALTSCTLEITQPLQLDPLSLPPLWRALVPHTSTLQWLSIASRPTHHPLLLEFCFYPPALEQWTSSSSLSCLKTLIIHSPPDLQLNMENCQELLDYLASYPVLETATVRWSKVSQNGAFWGMGDVFLTRTGRPRMLTVECEWDVQAFRIFPED